MAALDVSPASDSMPDAKKLRMAMVGNYGADAYDMTMTMTGEGGPNGGAMKMVVRSNGKHVADKCEG